MNVRIGWGKCAQFCRISAIAACLVLFASSLLYAEEEGKLMTTIILINSEAFLVDLDERGEILEKHVHVEDYFTSNFNHEALVRRSIDRMRDLSGIQKGHVDYDKYNLEEELLTKDRIPATFVHCESYYLLNRNLIDNSNTEIFVQNTNETTGTMYSNDYGSHSFLPISKLKSFSRRTPLSKAEIFSTI